MSGYAHHYDPYDATHYHNDMNYRYDSGPSSATGSSSYYRLPIRPEANTNIDRRVRDTSPPRKNPRLDSGAAISRRTASNSETRKRYGTGNEYNRERTASISHRQLPPPDVDPAINGLVQALQSQQDTHQERIVVEANNAKFIKYKDRDDISKENRVRAEKASSEIEEAERKDKLAWRAVGRKLRALMEVVLENIPEPLSAAPGDRNNDSDMNRSRESQICPNTPPRQASKAVAPIATSIEDSEREPGEIIMSQEVQAASPGPPPVVPQSVIPSVPSDANVVVKEKNKEIQAVTRASILQRFNDITGKLSEIKLETEERLNQFETTIEDLVRLEVADRIKKAKETHLQGKKKSQEARAQEEEATFVKPVVVPATTGSSSSSSSTSTVVARGVEAAEEVEIQGALSRSSPPQYSPHTKNVAPMANSSDSDGQLSTNIRKEVVDPGMSKEEVSALIESMRQAIRQEYDTKLFENEKRHEAQLIELRSALSREFSKVNQTQKTQMDILSNHHQSLNRHDQLHQSTLNLFSNVPKPTI